MVNKSKSQFQTKTTTFGGKKVVLYSIDGLIWSTRKDELSVIKDRLESQKVILEISGKTADGAAKTPEEEVEKEEVKDEEVDEADEIEKEDVDDLYDLPVEDTELEADSDLDKVADKKAAKGKKGKAQATKSQSAKAKSKEKPKGKPANKQAKASKTKKSIPKRKAA